MIRGISAEAKVASKSTAATAATIAPAIHRLVLRPYQREAIAAVGAYLRAGKGHPLVVLPTGTGKSVVIAAICKGALKVWPEHRILVVTHLKELIEQNHANILTTGFNAPEVDLIAMLRPTQSAGLYMQMLGRGTRKADGKGDCLVLDFAGNTYRHGPIDRIDGRRKRKRKGAGGAPVKDCPGCRAILHLSVRSCPQCGHVFPPQIAGAAKTGVILSSQGDWLIVDQVTYGRHVKPGSPPSLRVEYQCGGRTINEWVCLEHTGWVRQRAVAWWRLRTMTGPIPMTVQVALSLVSALPKPSRILVQRDRGYLQIDCDFAPPTHAQGAPAVLPAVFR